MSTCLNSMAMACSSGSEASQIICAVLVACIACCILLYFRVKNKEIVTQVLGEEEGTRKGKRIMLEHSLHLLPTNKSEFLNLTQHHHQPPPLTQHRHGNTTTTTEKPSQTSYPPQFQF